MLISYISEIYQNGHPDEPSRSPSNTKPDLWLDTAGFPSLRDGPPSFNSFHLGLDSKELAPREDNMKFPTTMKSERRAADSRAGERQYVTSPSDRRSSNESSGRPRDMPPPHLLTTPSSIDNNQVATISESSDDDSRGLVIRTTDLMNQQALTLRAPVSPSLSHRSHDRGSSFGSERERPRNFEYGASPVGGRDFLPMPVNQSTGTRYPGQEFQRLAPDANGNEIAADAKWTRVTRRLVSPEVLDQLGMRYEAYVTVPVHVPSQILSLQINE